MIQPLVPDFRRQVQAVKHVHDLLLAITSALDAENVPYAVIGGNAVASWVATIDEGAVRATKDVDLLIERADLERAKSAAAKADFEYHEVLGVPMFLPRINPNPKTGAHVIVANERVREGDILPSPSVSNSCRGAEGYVVLDLASLVMMKLLAFRLRDQLHIQDMLELGLITRDIGEALPEELRNRLEHIRTLR
jgi:hypothetical protein